MGIAGAAGDRREPRPPLRRLLDVRGLGLPVPPGSERQFALNSRDGVRLAAAYLPGPAATLPAAGVPAVVLAHGLAAHHRKPAYAELAAGLAARAAVLTFDFRGHGRSHGHSTLGDAEMLDIRAAGAWLRREGHRWVAVVGLSMGGSAAVRAAGLGPPGAFDAVCVVSTPAVWGLTDTPAMRVITKAATTAWGRGLARVLLGLRFAPRWGAPVSPEDVAGRVAPAPLLVVHGIDDHFFGPEQAHLLYAAAREPKMLWLEPAGFGHAEDGVTSAFVKRITAALEAVQAQGRWPGRAGGYGTALHA